MYFTRNFSTTEKLTRRRIRAHYEQLSELERGRVIGLKEEGWANRRITHHIRRSDATIKRCRQEWVKNGIFQRHDGSGRPRAIVDRLNQADWGHIVFSYESRFQLCPDDNRRCVWRHPGLRFYPASTIACYTGPQLETVVWGAISFKSRTPLVSIKGTLTAQWYVHDIMRAVLLLCLLQYPGLIFQQDNAKPYTTHVATELSYSLSNTSLASKIARYLSNKVCLGYDGQGTSSTRKC
ncbi:uncharacterized protein TNCV_1948641 [Trichonephila clavipes]|nr:uncharacterized protein TNCV_1948641 [Trichonephila clavipes]